MYSFYILIYMSKKWQNSLKNKILNFKVDMEIFQQQH